MCECDRCCCCCCYYCDSSPTSAPLRYACAPPVSIEAPNTYYFVGKVAAPCDGPGAAAAMARGVALHVQRDLAVAHAAALQPAALDRETLRLWFAPGDTEIGVAQDDQALAPLGPWPEGAAVTECGFEPEVYVMEGAKLEDGFRVTLSAIGTPMGPPVKAQFVDKVPEGVDTGPKH